MAKLIQTTEKIRVDTEQEAIDLIEKVRKDAIGYTLKKSSYVYKTKKKKGEVLAEWYLVELVKVFAPENPLEEEE